MGPSCNTVVSVSAEVAAVFGCCWACCVFAMLYTGPGLPRPKVEAAGPYHTGRSVQPRPAPSFVELKQPENSGADLPRSNWSREPGVQGYLPLRKGGLPRPLGKDSKADADSSLLVPVDPPALVFWQRLGLGTCSFSSFRPLSSRTWAS